MFATLFVRIKCILLYYIIFYIFCSFLSIIFETFSSNFKKLHVKYLFVHFSYNNCIQMFMGDTFRMIMLLNWNMEDNFCGAIKVIHYCLPNAVNIISWMFYKLFVVSFIYSMCKPAPGSRWLHLLVFMPNFTSENVQICDNDC